MSTIALPDRHARRARRDDLVDRNELVVADYADAIAAPAFAGDPAGTEHIACRCECGSIGCSEQIALTFDEYELVRSHTGSFAVAPAHGSGFRPLAANARFHHVEPADADF
jgi:hypothetical protein